ncbi:MAG: sugar ABC transporter ATP-binding protein [Blautia sp.]|nr:sugar ABC transporter ATP-binding protein [Blautia sp.]MDY5031607.1 sugar ABC transporter ATP-binding protein [Blautia sp.]
MSREPILQVSNIKKSFNGVEVLHNVSLSIYPGEVTALVGENGAGKSTLMKILMGEYRADGGEMIFEGKKVFFENPHQALAKGLSMVFQEMSPFPHMTVAQNMFVGREPHKGILIDRKAQRTKAKEILRDLNIHLDVNEKVGNLTVSEMQLLEIAKAVSNNSKIVIMDEPSSALSENEVNLLFKTIHDLTQRGVAIIYISHKLDELSQIADHVCVLRDGSIISSRPIAEVKRNVIISEMVGRSIDDVYPHIEKEIGEVVLEVENLELRNVIHNVSFSLRRGEILGIAGIVGAGRTELVSTLFGITPPTGGMIRLNGKEIKIKNPRNAIANHFALIPEDRARDGLNLISSIQSNMTMTVLDKTNRAKILSNNKEAAKLTDKMIQALKIKCNSKNQRAGSLSGGNQQKIVVGKWLLTDPNIIFLDEPTRGIDVGAKYEIYQLILNMAREGKSIIMISSEMPELLGICDRIIVMRDGHISGELSKEEANQEAIMQIIVNDSNQEANKNGK